jgi:hypothetical protein
LQKSEHKDNWKLNLLPFIKATSQLLLKFGVKDIAEDLAFLSEVLEINGLSHSQNDRLKNLFESKDLPYSTAKTDIHHLLLAVLEDQPRQYTETRELDDRVCELHLTGSVNVNVIQGNIRSIRVVANSKRNAAKMLTSCSGTVLHIDQEPTVIYGKGGSSTFVVAGRVGQYIETNHGAINIDMRGNDIRINGSSATRALDAEYIEVTIPDLKVVQVKGSGDVNYIDFSQGELEARIAGSGDITLSGKVGRLSAIVKGSGDIRAKNLTAERASLTVQGSGDIRAHISNEVDAKIMGSGDIKIYGKPDKVQKSVMGSGEITVK